jgi:hypothetical protein
MKKLLVAVMLVALLWVNAQAAELQWDFPEDWGIIDGYVIYFNETGQADIPYNKTLFKGNLTQDGVTVTYPAFEGPLNMQNGQQYDIWIVAYNAAGASGPSNIVQHSITAYTPPADSLPSGTLIQIPNAAVTIRVP